jgi:Fe-S cluster biogenesis protein NfuA/nitrite reductase/ring-hydroxylating ferredoxin subunit
VGDWQAAGERIDALLAASGSGGAVARERAEELVRLVADLYGAGLERLLDLLHEQGALTDDVAEALAGDELVSSLLLVHGLHPYDVAARIERALAGVRPYLGSHGGDVELVGLTEDGVARLRLLGSCDGCPSSSVTLKLAVQGAVEAAAPEVTAIEVEEPRPAGPVIPVSALFTRVGGGSADDGAAWEPVPGLAGLAPGAVVAARAGTVAIVACRAGADRYAFVDGCARCGASLAGAGLARKLGGGAADAVLTCPECRARYDVRRAGACLDDAALHLRPLPLLADPAGVSVAVPVPAGT